MKKRILLAAGCLVFLLLAGFVGGGRIMIFKKNNPTASGTSLTNLLLNPGFEDYNSSTVFNNWMKSGVVASSTLIVPSNVQKYAGNWSAVFVKLTSAYAGRGIYSDNVSVTPSVKHAFGGWFYVPAEAAPADVNEVKIRVQITWLDANLAVISTEPSIGTELTAYDTWQKINLVYTAPANATRADLNINAYESVNRDYNLFIDDAYLIAQPSICTLFN